MDIIVYPQEAFKIQAALENAVELSLAEYVILNHKGGSVVAESGSVAPMDSSMIAALAAGSYSSTTTMATMLGQSAFKAIEYVGENKAVALAPCASHFLVIFMFGSAEIPAQFKSNLEAIIAQIEPALSVIGQTSQIG
jgi:hypothetical protein